MKLIGATLLSTWMMAAAHAGPVEVYREGPQFCPQDRPKGGPRITQAQAIERARALLPAGFCGPGIFVSGCDYDPEYALDAWRVYVHQYAERAGRKDTGGLEHTYIILDPVGNCLANIPGTNPGAPN